MRSPDNHLENISVDSQNYFFLEDIFILGLYTTELMFWSIFFGFIDRLIFRPKIALDKPRSLQWRAYRMFCLHFVSDFQAEYSLRGTDQINPNKKPVNTRLTQSQIIPDQGKHSLLCPWVNTCCNNFAANFLIFKFWFVTVLTWSSDIL